MFSFRFTLRVSALVLAGAAAVWPAPSWAQSVTRSGDDRITIEAQNVPVGQVLRQLLAVAPIEALMIDPKVESHPVSVRMIDVTPGEAINQLLADSDLPYLLWGGARGPWRIFVGDKDAALRVNASSPIRDAGRDAAGAPTPQAQALAQKREATERAFERERKELQAREAEKQSRAMAERQAEAQPLVFMDDPGVPGGYTMIGESVTYNDPTFVPYKNRPEVRARRESTDIALIP